MSDIKVFNLNQGKVEKLPSNTIALEISLQKLFEDNLDSLLGVRFLAHEYQISSGRIDTLGLDENNCPVIIEYKRGENQNVITQGLFYLDWLMDHKDSFNILVMGKIGKEKVEAIDWAAPRLILVAGNFNKFDLNAVKQMQRNIDLIRYHRFGDNILTLDLLTPTTSGTSPSAPSSNANKTIYKTVSDIISQATPEQKALYGTLREYLFSLGEDIQEKHLKYYVAFKRMRNFACVELRQNRILIYANLDPKTIDMQGGFTRDMSNTGHFGTGHVEITLSSESDLDRAKPLLQKAYEN